MVNRVSKQEVVQGAPTVIATNNPDAIFMKDNPNVVFTNENKFTTSNYASGAFLTVDPAAIAAVSSTVSSTINTPTYAILDVPALADIEKIDFEEYFDQLTGVVKYKAILKIRNSSINKSSVAGVDARIYNPYGSTSYSFGTGTASTANTVSNYVSTTTWYHAQTVFNLATESIISGPEIVGTATYPTDGNGVPADSTSGPNVKRTKSVWRKTSDDALLAAEVYLGLQ